MTPQHVISQLLESDTKYPQNLDLLKKILITSYFGRLKINGLPPDNTIPLGNYIFDEERVMFDFSRLSHEKKLKFQSWLLGAHEKDKEINFLTGTTVNEYRGFTAEVELSWWGRIKNWFLNRYAEHWKINDLSLSLNYQLTGIDICHGNQGLLIGFDQFFVPPSGAKYKDPNHPQISPLRNTKTVLITDRLVDQLEALDVKKFKFEPLCKKPHPQSVKVNNPEHRFKEMRDYRDMQKFDRHPWYIRIWSWIVSLFTTQETKKSAKSEKKSDKNLTTLYEDTAEAISIHSRSDFEEILVVEKSPGIENLVLCGGGAKIFAHIGVWKALTEAKIRPTKFAGSSAGAIMSLLCYLGYSAEEIAHLFKNFKQENLVDFDIDFNGFSDTHSLKAAIDYAIAYKVKEIVTQYNIPYPDGKITFATLDEIKQQCPGCGIGDELIVTSTNIKTRTTRYSSLKRSPNNEVSQEVATSACFPVVYRANIIDGEAHNDGGILSNFPTEAFSDDLSTLLESSYGNNLKVLAVQFDNGTERSTVDRIMDKVYRENFVLNWIYSLITGVSDPASGWEQDRMKLRKYSSQAIVVNVDNVSSSGFTVDENTQKNMIQSGYQATRNYLNLRYNNHENQEHMYSNFKSLGDLLAYCCYRGNKRWFEIVNNLIVQSSLPNRTSLMKQSLELRSLYFNPAFEPERMQLEPQSNRFLDNNNRATYTERLGDSHNILLVLHPIFLKLSPKFIKSKLGKGIVEKARHSLSLHAPFACLQHFEKINEETHVLFHIIIQLIKELRDNPRNEIYTILKLVHKILYSNADLSKKEHFGKWNLNLSEIIRALKLLDANPIDPSANRFFDGLRTGNIPLQDICQGRFCEDSSSLEDSNRNNPWW